MTHQNDDRSSRLCPIHQVALSHVDAYGRKQGDPICATCERAAPGYADHLARKRRRARDCGLDGFAHPDYLFDFQNTIVEWALRKGRAAIFADTGLGKTRMQLAWADHIRSATGGRVLIVAPLAVGIQTEREAQACGIEARYRRADDGSPIIITNYEMQHHFDPAEFAGIVLDESSILKSHDGKTRTSLIERYAETPYRLCCTATPSPNDHQELGNHSEFLGWMTRTEMLATFFVHDGGATQDWRLKGHAVEEFWAWVASWAVAVRTPADLGEDASRYQLEPLTIETVIVDVERHDPQRLFAAAAIGLTDQRKAKRESIQARCEAAAKLVALEPSEPWIIWCDLNDEADLLRPLIPGAIEVRGSDPLELKESRLAAFSTGEAPILITKPRIAGFGLNWQHVARIIFVSPTNSYESFYQAIRRCWRFGQTRPVTAYVIASSGETQVLATMRRKQDAHGELMTQMTSRIMATWGRDEMPATIPTGEQSAGDNWTLDHGDCIDVMRGMDSASVDYSIYSPPFASLYTYTDDVRDMGNTTGDNEFFEGYRYAAAELFRITRPGRLVSFHCMDLPTSKARDGIIGLRDFRGDLIRIMGDAGFILHSHVTIWKDPVTAMQRTKALGLLYKQLKKDACMSRQGIPDYLITMRKPGVNSGPVGVESHQITLDEWQRIASPVWMDINPSDTLQYRSAREQADERHICPLQLDVIRRGIRLWSNPGDLVFSPFAGIGSEGVIAIEMGRRFRGVELKRSYYEQAARNLAAAESKQQLPGMEHGA